METRLEKISCQLSTIANQRGEIFVSNDKTNEFNEKYRC